MVTKDLLRCIKARPNGPKLWKESFNKHYNAAGFPVGQQFTDCVIKATHEVCPELHNIEMTNGTANALAAKLDG